MKDDLEKLVEENLKDVPLTSCRVDVEDKRKKKKQREEKEKRKKDVT